MTGRGTALAAQVQEIRDSLRALKGRRILRTDDRFTRLAAEIRDLADGIESAPCRSSQLGERFGVVAWNVQSGPDLTGLLNAFDREPRLHDAALYLLTEVDIAVHDNRVVHMPQILAEHLGTGYLYCNMDVLTCREFVLHGCALLSRWPVSRFEGVSLAEHRDKYHAGEARIGGKRALVARVELPDGPLAVAAVHLDPFASPRHRAAQIAQVIAALERMECERALIGGDFNCHTYNLASAPGLAFDIAHKLVRFGFDETVRQYMRPHESFERAVFQRLRQAGFRWREFNDCSRGTFAFDLNDPDVDRLARLYLPEFAYKWLRKRLAPWGCRVPMRIDWIAGRNLRPSRPEVLAACCCGTRRISDHEALVVDVEYA
jgi:endonuclease/exonuclease/phosphatase family metal-dependent hydrolase